MVESKNIIKDFPEGRIGKVRDWGEMKSFLPNSLKEGEMNLVHGYFKAQLKIAEGNVKKADKIFDALDKINGFQRLENEREDVFINIDIAVRGSTNRGKTAGYAISH